MNSRELIRILALSWMWGLSIVTNLIWWLAYIQGGKTTVYINLFSEMYVELVMWFIVLPIITVGLHYHLFADSQADA